MKHVVWISCLCWLSVRLAQAQDSTISLQRPYRAVFKLAPLSLLDLDATIQAGLEYRTGSRTSVQGEFGYGKRGLSPFGSDLNDFVSAEIWRGRSEIRFYTGRYRTNQRKGITIRSNFPLGNYWAIDGLFKQVNVVGQEYAYQPIYASDAPRYIGLRNTSRYVLASHLKIGRQFAFYDPYKRIFSRTLIDIYLGAGLRWAINEGPPPGVFTPFPTCGCGLGRSFTTQGSQWTPSVAAGLKVGFAL